MQKVECIKEYIVKSWPADYLVKKGEVVYFSGYLRGVHPVINYDSKKSFVVFQNFENHFKIIE